MNMSNIEKNEILIRASQELLELENKYKRIVKSLSDDTYKRHIKYGKFTYGIDKPKSSNLQLLTEKEGKTAYHKKLNIRSGCSRTSRSSQASSIKSNNMSCLKKEKNTKKGKSKSKYDLKLKVTQPFKLRRNSEPKGVTKIFGFGSFLEIRPDMEKPNRFPNRPARDFGWRTFNRRYRKSLRENPFVEKYSTATIGNYSNLNEKHLKRPSLPSFKTPSAPFCLDDILLGTQMKRTSMPFVTCRSTSRSFNLRVNLQEVLSMIKNGDGKAVRGSKESFKSLSTQRSGLQRYCPAMIKGSYEMPSNQNEIWGAPTTARCICFPVNQWQNQCLMDRYFGQKEPKAKDPQNSIQGYVDGLKKDWSIINGRLCTLMDSKSNYGKEWKTELESMEPELLQRESCYNEIQIMLKEVKETKARFMSWRRSKTMRKPTIDIRRPLRKVHSTLY